MKFFATVLTSLLGPAMISASSILAHSTLTNALTLRAENECKVEDRMYSNEDISQGTIETWKNDGTHLSRIADGHQWVTIVNLTPYRMVYTGGPNPYQFSVWDFGDIPSGKARKNEATYNTNVGSYTDTNGYANYRLDGTSKTFQVHVTTHIPDSYERRVVFDLGGMGMGWRELGFPGERASVALVITGSEQYGYINSLQLNNVAWMRAMYDVIKDRELRHVVVPGSHDAGMSIISTNSGWNGLGTASTTETQSLDHYNQLRVGTRYFDMRIVSVKGGNFWSAHINEEVTAAPVGATGESLDDLIRGVNRFTTDFPGEVIIWYIRSMVDLDSGKVTNQDDRYWDANKVNSFYTKLNDVNNRCIGLTNAVQLDMQPMKNFMGQNGNRGCVLLLTDGRLRDGLARDRVESGIYHGPTFLHRDDYWAQEQHTQETADKQIARMRSYTRDNGPSSGPTDNYFIMQWQCTPSITDVLFPPASLQIIANQETNPALYHYGFNKMSPESFPTVILHDAVGLFHVSDLSEAGYNPMMQTLVIGLNLYMVSQNCKVSTTKHPLLQAKQAAESSAAAQSTAFKTFSGVIFANGTVLDEAPHAFCRTCTYSNTSSVDHPPLNTSSSYQSRTADLRNLA
ncbi:PLC-like phosphodiesterase [Pleomassaria siparia CBS 279.74]|uniref:PLC-like phosphodiesterase n=1 Tax=Pleomassaria siparia CBS 279.74 TaxID=1314801 RepID=A0A6G1KPZ0_9PLEO|nr:PLC-like phosphodiesterase [Pleomassaria siparia CBS 279.74]